MGFNGPILVENTLKISNNRHIKNYFWKKIAFRISSFIVQVHISHFFSSLLPPNIILRKFSNIEKSQKNCTANAYIPTT